MNRKQKLTIVLEDVCEAFSSPLSVKDVSCILTGDTLIFQVEMWTREGYIRVLEQTFSKIKEQYESTVDAIAEREVYWYYRLDGEKKKVQL